MEATASQDGREKKARVDPAAKAAGTRRRGKQTPDELPPTQIEGNEQIDHLCETTNEGVPPFHQSPESLINEFSAHTMIETLNLQ